MNNIRGDLTERSAKTKALVWATPRSAILFVGIKSNLYQTCGSSRYFLFEYEVYRILWCTDVSPYLKTLTPDA